MEACCEDLRYGFGTAFPIPGHSSSQAPQPMDRATSSVLAHRGSSIGQCQGGTKMQARARMVITWAGRGAAG